MSSSDYELSRGAIEAGLGYDDLQPAPSTLVERVLALTEANKALLRREAELRKTVRRLRDELDECRRREAFLAESLQVMRRNVQAADEPWQEEPRWRSGRQDDRSTAEDIAGDNIARLIRDLVADSWREPRWRSD